jgi:LPS-assembly protein
LLYTVSFFLPQHRLTHSVLACASLIASGSAFAQGVCLVPITSGFAATDAEESTPVSTADLNERLEIRTTGPFGGTIDGSSQYSDVTLSYRGNEVSAESASISADGSLVELATVELRGEEFAIVAEGGAFDRRTNEATFASAELDLTGERRAHAEAADIALRDDGTISLNDLMFTTCPADDVDWELIAHELAIDQDAGFGKARGVVFRFKNVPFIYLPVMSFPVDDRRKSGFLTPTIAERDRTGFDLTVPYYLNLAPNYDLLLEPRWMEDRGTQIGSHFRYLLNGTAGALNIEYLPDDATLNDSRLFVNFSHASSFGRNVELSAYYDNVSDSAYFEDLGDNLGVISQTHLERYVDLGFYADRWSMIGRVQEYQTIDDQIAEVDRPYARLPQMLFRGRWGDRMLAFDSYAEAVSFDHTIGDTGWRFDATQELSLRFGNAGYYVTPAIGFRQTNYRLDATPLSPERTFSRGLPVGSLDAGLRFERMTGGERRWVQTIEPRLLYVNIPFEDQSTFPVFDTVLPEFNLIPLFSKYEFVGGDRGADADKVSFGLTTRLIGAASGRERLAATIGQTRYREPRRVLLPDETAVDSTQSNYVLRLDIGLSNNWLLDFGYQWNGETEETVRTETGFEYRPNARTLFGFGYRMREGVLEQGDLSMLWPVADRWRLIGGYSYSLLENKTLERLSGLEYEACCWLVRILSHSYIVRSTGQTDNTISLQFELKGLGNRPATPEELLGRDILSAHRYEQSED